MAGMPFPFGTRIEIGKNWVEKGSGIGNSPEFSGIPLGIPNQAVDRHIGAPLHCHTAGQVDPDLGNLGMVG